VNIKLLAGQFWKLRMVTAGGPGIRSCRFPLGLWTEFVLS